MHLTLMILGLAVVAGAMLGWNEEMASDVPQDPLTGGSSDPSGEKIS